MGLWFVAAGKAPLKPGSLLQQDESHPGEAAGLHTHVRYNCHEVLCKQFAWEVGEEESAASFQGWEAARLFPLQTQCGWMGWAEALA